MPIDLRGLAVDRDRAAKQRRVAPYAASTAGGSSRPRGRRRAGPRRGVGAAAGESGAQRRRNSSCVVTSSPRLPAIPTRSGSRACAGTAPMSRRRCCAGDRTGRGPATAGSGRIRDPAPCSRDRPGDRVRIGQWLEQHAVDDAEDRGDGADPERERERRDDQRSAAACAARAPLRARQLKESRSSHPLDRTIA